MKFLSLMNAIQFSELFGKNNMEEFEVDSVLSKVDITRNMLIRAKMDKILTDEQKVRFLFS